MHSREIAQTNRRFYDNLWSAGSVELPQRFNTWPLISQLLPSAPARLEAGAGLRPRLPIAGTHFVDISPPAIMGLNARGGIAVLGEITALPYGDCRFDLVAAFDVIEHVEEHHLIFRELSRVLKDGATLILSVPLHPASWTEFDEFVGHARRYKPAELLALIAEHGLVVEKSAEFGMKPGNPRLVRYGLRWLKRRRTAALWWYHRVFGPLGILLQKRLEFARGLIDTDRAQGIVLVCRRQPRPPAL